ncbi:MAG: hypothetical protein M3O46_01520 [Myxococcota bacterium]|nr:hypothetical protein [Myxococcota bacterium]
MRVSTSDPSVHLPTGIDPASPQKSLSIRDAGPSFSQVLRGLGREINGGEATMRAALGSMGSIGAGSDLGPAQLIALQAGVYRYSEAIELTSRLVDRATSGVKTIVQGGGQ